MVMAHLKSVRLTITGHVQGVGYRAFVEREARALGLTGWVRNRSDGSVETSLHGRVDAVDTMVALCQRGPRAAHVRHVAIGDEIQPPPLSFEVRATV
jgi:acylphosphatase